MGAGKVWGRSRKRNEAAGAPAESNMVEGVGFCLQRLVKPSSELSGQCKEEEGLASRDAGEGRYNTLGPAVSFFSLALSLFLTNRRERPRGRQRKTERKRKGARWRARLSSQSHSILSVTSGNAQRWRQALLTMCVKNAKLEKLVASTVPPLSRRGSPTKELHFHRPLAPTSGSAAGGFGGYTRQNGREDCEVHPQTRTFLNP